MSLSNRFPLIVFLTLLLLVAGTSLAAGQGERSSEYQGRLTGTDANASSVDVRITFYDLADRTRPLSAVDKLDVKVFEGAFKVPLEVPVAPGTKANAPSKGMEFEVAVRVPAGGSGAFSPLGGRVPVPPKLYDVASDALRVDSRGNVGIGTDSPQAKLDVNGRMKCDGRLDVGEHIATGGVVFAQGVELRAKQPAIDFTADLASDADYEARLWHNAGAKRLQLEGVPLWAGQYQTSHGGGLFSDGRIHISSGPEETVYINPWHGGTVIGGAGGRGLWIETPIFASQKAEIGGDMVVRGGVSFEKGLVTNGGTILRGSLEVGGPTTLGGNLHWPGRGHIQAGEDLYLNPFAGAANVVVGGGGGPGNLHVAGTLSKAAGSFKIDHPLDPENKFLSHSFVESPDMKNIYDGVVITDDSGYATIVLPDYFQALNQDFRYQLTVIDEADDGGDVLWAKVVRKIEDNQFKVRTARGNVEVSWQVTGIRHDAYAKKHPIQTETDKSAEERGLYLNPDAFDQPAEMGLHFRGAQDEASSAAADAVVNSVHPLATVTGQR